MLHFELYMMKNAPNPVKEFVYWNLFQRNRNHNNQNTAQGIDYKLEEYNRLFKQFEYTSSPSIEDWTKVASVAPKFKKIMEDQGKDYNIEYGLYSEPGAPDYAEKVKSCLNNLRKNGVLNYDKAQNLINCDGKTLKKGTSLSFVREFKSRRAAYLKLVTEENSFIKAELAFNATSFVDE